MVPNYCFWNNFRTVLESIFWGPKLAQQEDQKLHQLWNLQVPHLWRPGIAKAGIKREGWKRYWSWKYPAPKKAGSIYIYRESMILGK